MTVPYTFGTATSSIPLSQLDSNFATAITLGSTNVYLGNTTTTLVGFANLSSTLITSPTHNSGTTLSLQTGGTTGLYIDASQNVGIGTTSPSLTLNVKSPSGEYRAALFQTASTLGASVQIQGSRIYELRSTDTGAGEGGGLFFIYDKTAGASRVTVDASGNLLVGTTSNLGSAKVFSTTSGNFGFLAQCGNGNAAIGTTNTSGTAQYSAVSFFNNGAVSSQAGSITVSGSNTAYNTSSDYRLKENVTPMTTGLEKISALKPVTYDWITDKSEGEGFIAHELQAVIPHAVTGEKDAVDADGNPILQGVDYSKIVVHLVAALQELDAKFEAYKASHP